MLPIFQKRFVQELRDFRENPEVGALVLVLENADVSPSEQWNKIMTGQWDPFSP